MKTRLRNIFHFTAFFVVVLFTICSASNAQESDNPLGEMLASLNKTEQDIIIEALQERLPDKILENFSGDAQEVIKKAVTSGKHVHDLLELLENEVYSEFGKNLADLGTTALENEVTSRFTDPNSPVRKLLDSVKSNPDAWKMLAKSVLDANVGTAAEVARDALKDHAEKQWSSLMSQGTEFWKGMFREVIPGNKTFAKYNVDPVDIYLQGINDWADFVRKTGNRFHRSVLNCYQRRYGQFRKGGIEGAKDLISTIQLSRAHCGGRQPKPSFMQRAVAWAKNLFGGAATLGHIGLTPEELAEFLEEFSQDNGNQDQVSFADWLEDRFNENLSERHRRLTEPVFIEQARYAEAQAKMIETVFTDIFEALPRVLIAELGDKKFTDLGVDLPSEDYLPEGEVDEFSPEVVEEESKFQEKVEKAEELDCDRSDNGDGPDVFDENGCRPFGAATQTLEYHILPEVTAEAETVTPETPKPNPCAVHIASIDSAKDKFAAGDIESAHSIFRNVAFQLNQLADQSTCADLRAKTINNLAKTTKVVELISRVDDSLEKCDPNLLDDQAGFLRNAKNKRLADLHARIQRSKTVASEYARAKKAYWQGDMQHSRYLFNAALDRAKASRESCTDIEPRIEKNLRRIAQLQAFDKAAAQAVNTCDMDRVANLIESVRGNSNPFLAKAYTTLSDIPQDCRQRLGNKSCQGDFGQFAMADLANSSGDSYSCACQSGYAWKPDAANGEDICIAKREADRITKQQNDAWCLSEMGNGYYAGPMDREGNYYCLPTKRTANAWCRNNNTGSGLYAGRINRDGSFACHRKSTKTAKTKKRKKRAQQTARQRSNDAAAAAAVVGAILQGIDAYQRSQGGGYSQGGGSVDCSVNPMASHC